MQQSLTMGSKHSHDEHAVSQLVLEAPYSREVRQQATGVHGAHHKAVPDPERVCRAPQQLPPGLWMPSDAGHASLPEVQLRFVNRSHLQKIEGGWVQEQKRHEVGYPEAIVKARNGPDIPKLSAIISMVDKVEHCHGG